MSILANTSSRPSTDRALAQAAVQIAQGLQDFVAAQLDALVFQLGTLAAPVAGQVGAFEDLVIVEHLRLCGQRSAAQE